MNPKLLKILIIVLITITVIGAVSLVLVLNVFGEEKKDGNLSLDQMVEYSYQTEEMSTNLSDGSFVQIQFEFIADSNEAKEELEKREFQIKNEFIKQSVELTENDFQSGLSDFEKNLKTAMNDLMEDGKIIDVYIISKIIQ